MEIKIQLPNPDDYQYANGVAAWLSQMRISLKAAEKTYQEATKDLTDEARKQYYVDIGIPLAVEQVELMGKIYPADGISDIINENICIRVWSV